MLTVGRKEKVYRDAEHIFVNVKEGIIAKFYGDDADEYVELFIKALCQNARDDEETSDEAA
jgi:hypothetical protein